MEMDSNSPECSAGLDLYAEEACAKDEKGRIINIKSSNSQIREALETLFYDVLNIEFEAATWIRNMVKYGDQFNLIDHHPDYGVMGLFPLPVNEIEREQGYDEKDPLAYRYRWLSNQQKTLQYWEILHFKMPGNDTFHPYGGSVLEPARRPWRQGVLLEDAMMVYRIVRSPERRVFYIGIGNIDPKDVPAYMEKAKSQLKRNSVVDATSGRMDKRFNPSDIMEDFFIPVRGEGDGTRIEPLPGGQYVGDIDDVNFIHSKLLAALKIPKSYLGYEDDSGGKSQLTQQDVRFARTIQKIQHVFIAEMNKVAMIHLYSLGYRGKEILNFELTMANPSVVAELQKLELWRTRFEVASVAPENRFNSSFIYKNIFSLEDDEIEAIQEGRKKDKMVDSEIESMGAAMPPEELPDDQALTPNPAVSGGAEPEAGLPPPPGEENESVGPQQITASTDPMKQVAAPNDTTKAFPGKKTDYGDTNMPNLYNYATNTKKTASAPKRGHSQLMQSIHNPFREGLEDDEGTVEEQTFINKRIHQMKRFMDEIEKSGAFEKTKKLIKD